MADEFQGGTSTGGVTGDVTGSELAKVCQQSDVSVMGCNILTHTKLKQLHSLRLLARS